MLIVVASLMALVLVAGGGFLFFLNQKVSGNITHDDLLPKAAPSATLQDGSTVALPQKDVGENLSLIHI